MRETLGSASTGSPPPMAPPTSRRRCGSRPTSCAGTPTRWWCSSVTAPGRARSSSACGSARLGPHRHRRRPRLRAPHHRRRHRPPTAAARTPSTSPASTCATCRWGRAATTSASSGFSVRRYRQNRASFEVLVEVQSFATEPTRARLEILQDGEVIDVEPLELRPGERVQRGVTGSGRHHHRGRRRTRLEARLSPATPGPFGFLEGLRRPGLIAPWPTRLPLTRRSRLCRAHAAAQGAGAPRHGRQFVPRGRAPPQRERGHRQDRAHGLRPRPGRALRRGDLRTAVTPPEPPATAALYLDPQGPASPFRVVRDEPAVLVTELAERHPVMRWVTAPRPQRGSAPRCSRSRPATWRWSRRCARRSWWRASGARAARASWPSASTCATRTCRCAWPSPSCWSMPSTGWGKPPQARTKRPSAAGGCGVCPCPGPRSIRIRRAPEAPETSRARRARCECAIPRVACIVCPVVEGFGHFQAGRAGFYEVDVPGQSGGPDGQDRRRLLAANLADAAESAIRPSPTGELVMGGQRLGPPEGFVRRPARAWWMLLLLLAPRPLARRVGRLSPAGDGMNRRVALRLGLCLAGMLLLVMLVRLGLTGLAGGGSGPGPAGEALHLTLAGRTVESPRTPLALSPRGPAGPVGSRDLVRWWTSPGRSGRCRSRCAALFVASLALALARPALVGERQALCTVVLVDVSDSVSSGQLEEARAVIEELRREQAARRRAGARRRASNSWCSPPDPTSWLSRPKAPLSPRCRGPHRSVRPARRGASAARPRISRPRCAWPMASIRRA